jgi:hypothetical protein
VQRLFSLCVENFDFGGKSFVFASLLGFFKLGFGRPLLFLHLLHQIFDAIAFEFFPLGIEKTKQFVDQFLWGHSIHLFAALLDPPMSVIFQSDIKFID